MVGLNGFLFIMNFYRGKKNDSNLYWQLMRLEQKIEKNSNKQMSYHFRHDNPRPHPLLPFIKNDFSRYTELMHLLYSPDLEQFSTCFRLLTFLWVFVAFFITTPKICTAKIMSLPTRWQQAVGKNGIYILYIIIQCREFVSKI